MKKRIAALLAAILLLGACSALAEDMFPAFMEVVNCSEWVSLRAQPDTKAERLIKVPLGALVYDCSFYSEKWVYAEYEGLSGFILAEYLQAFEYGAIGADSYQIELSYGEIAQSDCVFLHETVGGRTIVADRSFENRETLRIACFEGEQPQEGDSSLWCWVTYSDEITELDATGAFLSGTLDEPAVMLYNMHLGLMRVEIESGDGLWNLPAEDVSLGGSIVQTTDRLGNMYIAGYYGPDPVAISMQGEVLWTSVSGDPELFWPYEMHIDGGLLLVTYAANEKTAAYDLTDGSVR